jgi:hypothetical protein
MIYEKKDGENDQKLIAANKTDTDCIDEFPERRHNNCTDRRASQVAHCMPFTKQPIACEIN